MRICYGTAAATLAAGLISGPVARGADIDTPTIEVVSTRSAEPRSGVLSETGSSVYRFNSSDISQLAQGDNASVNQILLRAPGVAQDSFGQVHIRGEHANLQYRINGILIPESISGFGQTLDPRFFSEVNLLTGALPAEFGYRTAGVVDVQSKNGGLSPGGSLGVYGGSNGTLNPSGQLGGKVGRLDYYLTGQYLHSDRGIENPTASSSPIHDNTNQYKDFGYLSYALSDSARLTTLFGTAVSHFQIPNAPGATPQFSLDGVSPPPALNSAALNENQREVTHYGIVAFKGQPSDVLEFQVAGFTRYSQTLFSPDLLGDLVFNGVASQVYRSSYANGVQADATYHVGTAHTLSWGLVFSGEHAVIDNTSSVFAVDNAGNQLPGAAFQVVDNTTKNATLAGVYVQDHWQVTAPLTVNYGLRFDTVNAFVTEHATSPRLGALYQAGPATTVHAGYAHYFTPPPTELVGSKDLALFQNTTNAPQVTQNDAVKSERANYFDVGVSHQCSAQWTTGVDLYYKQVRNLLDEGQFGAALVFTPFNYERGKIYGAEFTNAFKQGDLSGFLNIALSQARGTQVSSAQFNFSADELAYISSHYVELDHDQHLTASAGASYLWKGTTYSVDGILGSGLRSGFANTDRLPYYTQVDVGASRGFELWGFGKMTGRLAVVNLFDRSYEIRSGTGIGVGAPQFGPRRGVFAGVTKLF